MVWYMPTVQALGKQTQQDLEVNISLSGHTARKSSLDYMRPFLKTLNQDSIKNTYTLP